jgi:hypothetical protein
MWTDQPVHSCPFVSIRVRILSISKTSIIKSNQKEKRPAISWALSNPSPFARAIRRNSSAMIISSSDTGCKSHHACHVAGDDSVIRIEHAVTLDLPDGRPTLPLDDYESLWALVTPLPDGFRLWRRIYL